MAEQGKPKGVATGLGLLAAVGVFFLKFKVAILGALKAGWLLKSTGSMLVSLGLYTAVYGWRFAVALIALLYIHEMGHYLIMKVKGLNPNAPVFVPFLGAYVAMTKLPDDPITHAWVAYAGPFIGGLAAVAMYYLGLQTDNHFLAAAASFGFVLNLMQLIPAKPFDGGFIAECISKWFLIPGIIVLALMTLSWQSIMLTIICLVAVVQTYNRFRHGSPYDNVKIPVLERLKVGFAYVGLAVMLGYYYWQSESALKYLHSS